MKYVLLIDVGLSHCPNDYKPSTLEECPPISEVIPMLAYALSSMLCSYFWNELHVMYFY